MNCCKHIGEKEPVINYRNVMPNEHFGYSVVLICGEILNFDHRHGLTHLRITNGNIANWCIEKADITTDGKFKLAVELASGVNLLRFQYCCVVSEIPLIYTRCKNPRFLLKVFYIIAMNHDGHFQTLNGTENSIEIACEKINLVIRLVQCIYAEMLAKNGFDRKSFEFVKCQPFRSRLSIDEARQLDQTELWTYHAKEIVAQEIDTQHHYKYLGILASTVCENGAVKGNAALGIGDVAIFGGGTLYAWPLNFKSIENCFRNKTLVDPQQLLDDSNGRHTFGGCFATAVGSICHEIGHIFDLGHTNDGIMGNDIDYVNRMFTIEKCPRNLPRRISSACTMNEKKQNNILNVTDRRLTAVKKTNSILANYHNRKNDDLTFLTENCAILLNYHKWFNQTGDTKSDIRYDYQQKVIISLVPLILVELRSNENGMCMKYYRCDVSSEHNFQIPSNVIKQNYDLIAVDKNGTIKRFTANDYH